MVSKNAHRCAQNVQNGFSFDVFLEQYHKDGKWISQSHHMCNRWWNLGFICECWNQREVKAVDAQRHSPNKPKKFKQTLSVRKLMEIVFWDRKKVLMVEFMQQGTTIMSEVYCETLKKTVQGHSEQMVWNADIRCSAPPRQCASAYSCSHLSTAGAFQLVVWPPSLQPWSHSERLPPAYPPEELFEITMLRQ
jgi:hypothetical protein